MASPSMYVRIKRRKQTIFLHCEPSDTVLSLKEKVAAVTGKPVTDQRLLLGKQNLEDASTLSDSGLTAADTGTELFIVYKIVTETEERWEEVGMDGEEANGELQPVEEAAKP
eukprot:TRINITY_DN26014_c0_g1_i1.p1 TRINITY_DN26014_c0_g1~~TRINITY_DN26014_c0_g1_i1.p1  ORF type:complete len:127 (+),score=49.52 TRINITY_DN26014_c0_g1_i1:48-383(+)